MKVHKNLVHLLLEQETLEGNRLDKHMQTIVWEHNFEHFHVGQSESQLYLKDTFFTTKCGRCPDLLSTSLAFTDPGEGHIPVVFCPQTSLSALPNMFLRMSSESWQASTLNCFPQIVRDLSEIEAVSVVEWLEVLLCCSSASRSERFLTRSDISYTEFET